MLKLCVLLAVPLACYGFILNGDPSNWNSLKVTWSINPLSGFKSMPRTRQDALHGGWKQMAGTGPACDSNPKFLGHRFTHNGDTAVILIYDDNGYIAGIQLGFSRNYSPNVNNYPFSPLIGNSVILDGDMYYVTAYFVDPANVCSGRSAAQFRQQGTGTGLWIQNGTNPIKNSVTIPLEESDVGSTAWTRGACFVTMGQHYWYDISKSMNCDYFFPVFLLYNGGKLNGFGWALAMDLENFSSRIEHPPQTSYGNFMSPPPDCLSNLGIMTTMHIYMTSNTFADLC